MAFTGVQHAYDIEMMLIPFHSAVWISMQCRRLISKTFCKRIKLNLVAFRSVDNRYHGGEIDFQRAEHTLQSTPKFVLNSLYTHNLVW